MKKLLLIVSATLLLIGSGCTPETPAPVSESPKENKPPQAAQAPATETWVHPKFGFAFQIPLGVIAKVNPNGDYVNFIDATKNGVAYALMIVQPDIPGIPLVENKVEKIKVDGVAGHLYHDTDQADGGNVDKLIVDFPNGKNTVYISTPELPGQEMWDLKAIAKSWKWKK